MKKILLSAAIAGLTFNNFGQVQIADFETPLNSSDTAWFGQDLVNGGDTTFMSDGIEFSTNFNATWGIFSGWAYSNSYDQSTPGSINQFSSITGSGAQTSAQFGICNVNGNTKTFINPNPHTFSGAYFTNTTYAYLSMQNGDMFAKQFGDSTDANGTLDGTNGEDWFLLTVYGLTSDSTHTGDSVNFYLADYRFSDNTQDYIVSTWEYVDLSSLGLVYGLDFKLTSSDVGGFGMNTPGYFAMDNLSAGNVSVEEQEIIEFNMYPNPAQNLLNINLAEKGNVSIIDITGKTVFTVNNISGLLKVSLEEISSGIYFVKVNNENASSTQKLIKK